VKLPTVASVWSPSSVADVLLAAQRDQVTMIAARWRTAAGPRVTAYRVAIAVQQLFDGNAILGIT
jgi:hypothetical protein